MKNFFDIKALKSSKDCDKYSKRFLYKNLVGGTATTGTNIKQTQKMFLGNAVKPLTAVGTLTSLLCNSAKVVEKWLQISPVFRLIKILGLVLVLSVGIITESRAEEISCVNGKYADGTACEKCGDNCNWSFDLESGKLSVTGSGKMYNNYSGSWDSDNKKYISNTPWADYMVNHKIKSVDMQGVENISTYAFSGSNGSLKQANIGDSVKSIGGAAFYGASIKEITLPESLEELEESAFEYSGLTGAVIPDSVTDIHSRAFAYNDNFSTVIIPDTIKNLKGWGIFSLNYDTVKIICKGSEETCAELKKQAQSQGYNVDDNFSYANSEQCTKSYIYENGICHKRNEYQCNSTENYYWNGSGCVYRPSNGKISCYGTSHKENDGYCDRIRYTPAEAAQVLKNDNTNEVTITFRK